ncbi:hypothetical protein HWV07_18560 [Natronomonas salina]|nr:hypothetical protein [Natronomonas salina]QLD90941.1 hypothetical protein HWV07_18560 [Natronomonas salina]
MNSMPPLVATSVAPSGTLELELPVARHDDGRPADDVHHCLDARPEVHRDHGLVRILSPTDGHVVALVGREP